MKHILVFAGSAGQYNFFRRLSLPLTRLGYGLICLVVKPSLAIRAKRDGVICSLVRNSRSTSVSDELRKTTEVAANKVPIDEASKFFNGVVEHAVSCLLDHPISHVFIWNGHSIPSAALAKFAHANALPTLYFELSNLPGKIFVDKAGVNAGSSLFDHPEQLDSYHVEDPEYDRWREAYIAFAAKQALSQAATEKASMNNFLFPLDSLGAWFDLPTIGEMHLIRKTRQKFLRKNRDIAYDDVTLANAHYLFFPMQVSDDSQILFNSDVTLYEALDMASGRAKDLDLDLLIKPHPLEESREVAGRLNEIRNRERTFIVNAPSLRLVEHCREVMTINSTVGLEAMIAGKPVTFLGRTFYRSCDGARLKKYILRHLINIDYFGNEEVSVGTMSEVLSRI